MVMTLTQIFAHHACVQVRLLARDLQDNHTLLGLHLDRLKSITAKTDAKGFLEVLGRH